jgi:phosphoribosylformimino-5-aminoimidazole carboxamide ribotide isomerase
MELIPAIDLQGGAVVRLRQGDFSRRTSYGDDPLAVARRWVGEGATRLHLVDLDGARSGRPAQHALVRSLVRAVDVPCQVAGGIRDAGAAGSLLDDGADRVVLGSALLARPALGRELVARHGAGRVVAALDVRDGLAVGAGWVPGSPGRPFGEALDALLEVGVEWFAVTAISRDGLLAGPDLDLLAEAVERAPAARIIASGGIATADDIRAVARLGCAAAILGRALYEGQLSMATALTAARTEGDRRAPQ